VGLLLFAFRLLFDAAKYLLCPRNLEKRSILHLQSYAYKVSDGLTFREKVHQERRVVAQLSMGGDTTQQWRV
jgi:hypothetical protein